MKYKHIVFDIDGTLLEIKDNSYAIKLCDKNMCNYQKQTIGKRFISEIANVRNKQELILLLQYGAVIVST